MKSLFSYSLLAAVAASGMVSAQIPATATTPPVGYSTQALTANQFNLVGLTLQAPIIVNGVVTSVSGNSLTATASDFSTLLTAGRTYVLEIKTGTKAGLVQEFVAWSGTTLTTIVDLQAQGVAATNQFSIRVAPTLEETFGTTDSVLTKGAVANIADIVWIPTGPGTYSRYYLSNGNVWKNATSNTNSPNVPLIYLDGILIEKKGAGASIVLSGEVKTKSANTTVTNGFNVVSSLYPAGSTLQNSGLENGVAKGAVANIADIVWLPNGTGGYDRYYYHSSNVWRNATSNVNAPADVPLPSAFLIERKGAAAEFSLTPPASYSSL